MNAVDDYIATFPPATVKILKRVRAIIRENAPEAVESISYKMAAYKFNGKPLVYFAAYKNHVGLYATPAGHAEFAKELAGYKQGKGSVQFPLDRPVPYDLIGRIVRFKVSDNLKKARS
jgi:uncharacterized protein YdhG (YjbR/CyaY superfamily)